MPDSQLNTYVVTSIDGEHIIKRDTMAYSVQEALQEHVRNYGQELVEGVNKRVITNEYAFAKILEALAGNEIDFRTTFDVADDVASAFIDFLQNHAEK